MPDAVKHYDGTKGKFNADPPLVGLFIRPAVDYYRPKMQELHWLSSALRLLRRPAA